MNEQKKAVVSILGADRKGIIAAVTRVLYEYDVNILDISQTIVSGLFSMILIADISSEHCVFEELKNSLTALGEKLNVQIRIQRSEIFEAMHQI
ncbi:MAG: ACT domain-containing protein [Clostridiales bacterium]|nr:ACT domain-containing protein [Clostridiales bacterium]